MQKNVSMTFLTCGLISTDCPLRKLNSCFFVTKKGCKENIELKVFNTKIKTVSDVKSYEQHFHYIIGKMSKLLCVLYNTKHLLELYI